MNISVVDSFDLPDWLGTEAVTWRAAQPLDSGAHVEGGLTSADDRYQGLDLLAVDSAYPTPVCPDSERKAAHQAWQFGEVVLLEVGGRVAAGVPGRCQRRQFHGLADALTPVAQHGRRCGQDAFGAPPHDPAGLAAAVLRTRRRTVGDGR